MLVGITVCFFVFLNKYEANAFYRQTEQGISDLELMTADNIDSAAEIIDILERNEYVFFDNGEKLIFNDEARQQCLKYVNKALGDIKETRIYEYIADCILTGEIQSAETYQYIGYIGKETTWFTLAHVWLEKILIEYDVKTGIIYNMECYVPVSTDSQQKELEEAKMLLDKQFETYYTGMGGKNGGYTVEIFDVNGDEKVLAVRFINGKFLTIEEEKIQD